MKLCFNVANLDSNNIIYNYIAFDYVNYLSFKTTEKRKKMKDFRAYQFFFF